MSAVDSLQALTHALREKDAISFGDLLTELGEHGVGMVVLVLGAASLIPGPAPIFGAALCMAGVALLLGRDVIWRPGWLRHRRVRASRAIAIINRVTPLVTRLERHFRRRWPGLLRGRRLIGLACIANGIVIILPIPGGNATPAISALILSVGLVASDGLAIVAGLVASLIGVAIAAGLGAFGFVALRGLVAGS
jgi:hypothetical protein